MWDFGRHHLSWMCIRTLQQRSRAPTLKSQETPADTSAFLRSHRDVWALLPAHACACASAQLCLLCMQRKQIPALHQSFRTRIQKLSFSMLTGDTNMVLNIATATPVTFSELLQSLPLAGLTPGLEFFWLKSLPFPARYKPGWTNIAGFDQRSGLSRTSWSRTTGSHLPSARTGTGQDL